MFIMAYYKIKVIISVIHLIFHFYQMKTPNKLRDEHTLLSDLDKILVLAVRIRIFCTILYLGCLYQLLYYWYVVDYTALEMDIQQWVGMVMLFGGILLRKWSYYILGRFFVYGVAVIKNHKLITTGPYRFMMHPGFASLNIVAISAFLIYGNLAAAVAAFLQISFFSLLSGIEETALTQHLGGEYKKYASERSRFIPFLF